MKRSSTPLRQVGPLNWPQAMRGEELNAHTKHAEAASILFGQHQESLRITPGGCAEMSITAPIATYDLHIHARP